jgi:hypothetical protein
LTSIARPTRVCPSHIILLRAAVRFDECSRVKPAPHIFAITRSDERRDELAHFEMQMGKITATRGPDGSDLLATPDLIASLHEHCFDMPVTRLHVFSLSILDGGMQHNDDVPQPEPPSRASKTRPPATA